MIARIWDGVTKSEDADEYLEYIRQTGVKGYAATDGNRAVYVLRREDGAGGARFRLISFWDSLEAVRRFAGDEVARARYYPEDERFLQARAPEVEHYAVVDATVAAASPEGRRIAQELRTLLNGDAWHGPALFEILADVTAERAAARPLGGAHTIWELVLHVTGWADVVRRRLEREVVREPDEGDFPQMPSATAEAWAGALERLRRVQDLLIARLASLDAEDLDRAVPGRDHAAREMARGVLQHLVYHAGQIALLKRAAGSASFLLA